jgi:WD40 repeat protein
MTKITSKKFLISISLVLALSLGFFLGNKLSIPHENEAKEKIALLDWNSGSVGTAFLMMMSSDGASLQRIGMASGSIDWDKTGRYLATGCEDHTKICIFDSLEFVDYSVFPRKLGDYRDLQKISIPVECIINNSFTGINSLSWSTDSTKFVVVCQNKVRSTVCVIDQKGEYECWEEGAEESMISRADWSPVSDMIVIDKGKGFSINETDGIKTLLTQSTIQIVNPRGEVIQVLGYGWSPSWSSTGQEVAIFRWDEERGNPGIGVLETNGGNFRWIYRPPKKGEWDDPNNLIPGFTDLEGCMGPSKLTWSSDNKYVFTDALYEGYCIYRIFRIEVQTGEITSITTNLSDSYHSPDIQP